jgi:hypothetical protein
MAGSTVQSTMNVAKGPKIAGASAVVAVAQAAALYALILWEGSSAREDAPVLEAKVAQWLLHYTVPADVGGGKTEIGSGQYPRPPDLRSAAVFASDSAALVVVTDAL